MDETTGSRRTGQWSEADVDADGVRLHIHRTGHGDLSPLVLAHGLSDNALSWTRVAQALEADFDIVMIDARNHGQSGTAIGNTEAMARDVVAVIGQLNDHVTTCYIGEAGHNIRRENFDGYMEAVGRFLRESVLSTTNSDD